MLCVVREQCFCLLVRNAGVDDDIVTFAPVDRCCYSVLVSKLKGFARRVNILATERKRYATHSQSPCVTSSVSSSAPTPLLTQDVPDDLIEVTTDGRGIEEHSTDGLLRIDDEDGPDLQRFQEKMDRVRSS